MLDDTRDRRVQVAPAIRVNEADVEIHADDAAGLFDRVELAVGEIARRRRQRVGVGVRCDDWRVGEIGDIPETLLVDMRHVNQNAQPVACPHQVFAQIG